MGEPASEFCVPRQICLGTQCAQANSVCLDAEQTYMTNRERVRGDSARIASVGFVDDMHFRFAYDRQDLLWTRQEAEDMLVESRTIYPAPLVLE
jgi:hypothetical protein